MKAASSSIYRRIEQLLFWASGVIDRLPGTTSYKELGKKAMLDMEESLDLVALALQDGVSREQRVSLIDALSIRMGDLKTIFRLFREKSKNIPEREIKEIGEPEKPQTRILTSKQYATFISQMFLISSEMKAWRARHTGEGPQGNSRPEK